jgi:hypothetical protein
VPTYGWVARFRKDLEALSDDERATFDAAVAEFVAALKEGSGRFPKDLRVHRLDSTDDVWSMSWSGDGRATFTYGDSVRPGEAHIIWRRVGTHKIYRAP